VSAAPALAPAAGRALRIAFIHPDLGLGGAERYAVDVSLALAARGHRVSVLTTRHDPERCFPETLGGAFQVRVLGDVLPAHLGHRLRAPCTIARLTHLACHSALRAGRFDVILCDLVAHVIPLVRRLGRAPIVYFCHFPDRLLAPRRGWLYRLYRAPIDRLEAVGIARAARVLVTSRFSAATVRGAFPHLRPGAIDILMPAVDVAPYDRARAAQTAPAGETGGAPAGGGLVTTLLSLSRFERKKNLGLAIEALARLREGLPGEAFARLRLVIAGGHDAARRECEETARDLQALARRLSVADRVVFRRNLSETERLDLLLSSAAVVYTPEGEHFGLVPLEAMAAARPVVAVRSGGPLETILHGETGYLCEPTPDAFARALTRIVTDPAAARRMGEAGRAHVRASFSPEGFGSALDRIVREVAGARARAG